MPKLGIQSEGEYISRCPSCGDSDNKNHGHLSINLHKGLYHCLKCGYSGKLRGKDLFNLGIEIPDTHNQQLDTTNIVIDNMYPFSVSKRFSKLARKTAIIQDNYYDYVDITNQNNERVGFHLRLSKPKMSYTLGKRGIGFVGDTLVSSYENPIHVVEGIYDVLEDRDVCVFGFITKNSIRFFKSQYVVLAPDGDVWKDRNKYKLFLKTIRKYYYSRTTYLKGIRYIPDGKDIDEIEKDRIQFIDRESIGELLSYYD